MKTGIHGDVFAEPVRSFVAVGGFDVRKLNFCHNETFVSTVEHIKLDQISVGFRNLIAGFFYYNAISFGGKMKKLSRERGISTSSLARRPSDFTVKI